MEVSDEQKTVEIKQSFTTPLLLSIASILCILVAVVLFTRPAFHSLFDFSSTGQIGDTIGGIAAPIVGILASILVYVSFRAQVQANKDQKKALEREFSRATDAKDLEVFFQMYDVIVKACERFSYAGQTGFEALGLLTTHLKKDPDNLEVDEGKVNSHIYITMQLFSLCRYIEKTSFDNDNKMIVIHLTLFMYISWFSDYIDLMIAKSEPADSTVYMKIKTAMSALSVQIDPEDSPLNYSQTL